MDERRKAMYDEVAFELEMSLAMRDVFSTRKGRMVLDEILGKCGVFKPAIENTAEAVALRNFGMSILLRCGLGMSESIDSAISTVFTTAQHIAPEDAKKHLWNKMYPQEEY